MIDATKIIIVVYHINKKEIFMSKDEKGTLVSVGSGSIGGSATALAGVALGAAEGTAGAAALVSGLAYLGMLVGGGMMAGIGVVCAAPILGGAACYGAYKLCKKI